MNAKKKQLKRIIGLGFLLWLHGMLAFAQREADNWYFGDSASLEFPNGGSPVSFQNSAMFSYEGSASISDKNGNLLFYSDGQTVWNNLHQVMKNGTGLLGNQSAAQSCLIVPKPGSNSIYYLFTVDSHENFGRNGLRYSTIDISKDSVLAKGKNTLLYGTPHKVISEKITGVFHFNNRDVWVVAHFNVVPVPLPDPNFNPVSSQEFVAFKVTSGGVTVSPQVSALPVPPSTSYGSTSTLKASPTGKYLSGGNWDKAFLFDFNNKTGSVSNPLQLMSTFSIYGTDFSPDGSKLYWTDTNQIHQFDLLAGSPAAIVASKTKINGPRPIQHYFRSMQVAPDGKIYIKAANSDTLYRINSPALHGTASSLLPAIKLQVSNKPIPTTFGLPNFIQSYFAPPKFTFSGTCAGSPVKFTLADTTGIDSVKWNFGDAFGGVTNTSTVLHPTHIYSFSGNYEVSLSIFTGGDTVFVSRPVRILSSPPIDLGPDQKVCEDQKPRLRNPWPIGYYNETYEWGYEFSNGVISTDGVITAFTPGWYWLDLKVGDCVVRDSVFIKFKPKPEVTLSDKSVCGNAPVTLDATYTKHAGARYLWTPGNDTTATLTVTKNGIYTVVVDLNGCTATDSARVTFIPDLDFSLGEDVEVCEGTDIYLRAPLPNPPAQYFWSDSTTNRYIIKPTKSGKYWVRLTRGDCIVSDTINITFKPCPPPPVPYIPNIITPNNDGFNDKLEITGIPVGAWNLKIYNRWGQLQFEKKGYQNNWPEKTLTDGSYHYFLEDPDTGRTWKGWIQVTQ